jgi:hypothetical protein
MAAIPKLPDMAATNGHAEAVGPAVQSLHPHGSLPESFRDR